MKKVLVALAVIALAGCSSTPPAAPTPTPPASPTLSTPSATPTPTPSKVALKVGDTHKGQDVDVTVSKIEANTKLGQLPERYFAVEAKVCITSAMEASMSSNPWEILDDDYGRFNPIVLDAVGGLPAPAYPQGTKIGQGECVKGWIYFQIPQDTKITGIYYAAGDDEATWLI